MTAATMRRDTAGRARRLAAEVQEGYAAMGTHNHLRDAAKALDSGNTEGAQRHLRAAAGTFTPQSLMRHGHLTDDKHMAAKSHMGDIHRMILLVKDAEDTRAREEQQAAAKRAMNAPAHQGLGRPDGTAQGPSAPIGEAPKEARRLPARSWIAEGVESAGPKLLANGQKPYYVHPGEDVECPYCHKMNEDDAKFCDQCGRALPKSAFHDLSVDLSAQTARLAATPAPRGRPGGPGLYDVSGMGHTDYLQQIVKALIEKRGMEPGKAYAIARGAIRRWARGGGNVHPEVRAAAGAAEAGELARQARAKAVHGHSNTGPAVELSFNPFEHRNAHGEWSDEAMAKDLEGIGKTAGIGNRNSFDAAASMIRQKRYTLASSLLQRAGGSLSPPLAARVAAHVQRLSGRGDVAPFEQRIAPVSLSSSVELVGPKGYVHGWHFVGVPGSPGSYKSLANHPQLPSLNALDRHVVMSNIAKAKEAAESGDHTMAERYLGDAHRRTVAAGAHSLGSAIQVVENYHRDQATSFLPKPRQGGLPGEDKTALDKYDRMLRTGKIVPGPSGKYPNQQAVDASLAKFVRQHTMLANPNHDAQGRFTTPQNAQQHQKGKHPGKGSMQRARAKGQLLTQANEDSKKAAALRSQLHALVASMRSGGSGSTSKAGGTSKSATSSSKAASGKTSTSGASGKSKSLSRPGSSAMRARITQLRDQIHALEHQARQLRAQAAKL